MSRAISSIIQPLVTTILSPKSRLLAIATEEVPGDLTKHKSAVVGNALPRSSKGNGDTDPYFPRVQEKLSTSSQVAVIHRHHPVLSITRSHDAQRSAPDLRVLGGCDPRNRALEKGVSSKPIDGRSTISTLRDHEPRMSHKKLDPHASAAQATRYCEEIKRSKDGWRLALELFRMTARSEARFFSLGCLQEALGARAGAQVRVESQHDRYVIREGVMDWLKSTSAEDLASQEPFIRTKV